MNTRFLRISLRLVIIVAFTNALAMPAARAQGPLGKIVPLDVTRMRLDHVLEILSNKGNFYFSYNSNIINKDSLVTLSVNDKTVGQVLKLLFNENYQVEESGNYIIIRKAPIRIPVLTSQDYSDGKVYIVKGYVLDESSGEGLASASVYDKKRLLSTLTDNQGYFEIRLKSKPVTTALTFSRQFYQDTTIVIRPQYNQQLRVAITPADWDAHMVTVSPGDYFSRDSIVIDVQVDSVITTYHYLKNDSVKVERTVMARMLLSSKQKIQSLNLKKFFTERPFQLSLFPGVSTHGWLNAQVVNKISLNIIGGYSAGVNGVEAAGWFNIDKKDVRWVQLAGWFNVVGGSVTGLQASGIHNMVLGSLKGVQYSGISNVVKDKFTGLQAAGIYNHVGDSITGAQMGGIANYTRRRVTGLQAAGIYNHAGDSLSGAQMAGIANFTRKRMNGFQAAAIVNVSGQEMKGVQVSGIVNYTKRLKGVQIGLINIADTSDGYSIGLINVVLKGYHQLVFSANELTNTNAAFKTGNKKLYSILEAGMQAGAKDKLYSFGYGIGRVCTINKQWSISPELMAKHLYLGTWDYVNLLNRLNINVNLRLGKYVSLSAGPAFSAYYSNQPLAVSGYKYDVATGYHPFGLGGKWKGWFGWNASINLF